MRMDGCSYTKIANSLNISVNTVKSYGRREKLKIKDKIQNAPKVLDNKKYALCKNCGTNLLHKPKAKPKKFCSSKCRQQWWKNNTDKINKLSVYYVICNHCGIEFESYGNRHRKYCNHECYIQSRFGRNECGSTV